MPGRVLVLNGASSTGKSSIVRAFCDRRAAGAELWFHAGVDDVLAKVSHPWIDVGWPAGPGPYAADGMRIVDTADGPSVRWVAVRCDPAEMARRERARGDRPIGLAAAQATTVHRGIAYDVELDTTDLDPDAAAAMLEALMAD